MFLRDTARTQYKPVRTSFHSVTVVKETWWSVAKRWTNNASRAGLAHLRRSPREQPVHSFTLVIQLFFSVYHGVNRLQSNIGELSLTRCLVRDVFCSLVGDQKKSTEPFHFERSTKFGPAVTSAAASDSGSSLSCQSRCTAGRLVARTSLALIRFTYIAAYAFGVETNERHPCGNFSLMKVDVRWKSSLKESQII